MATRVLFAAVGTPLLLWVLYGLPPICLACALSLLSAVGVHEALWGTGCVKDKRVVGVSMVLTAGIPLWVYFGSADLPAMAGLFVYTLLLFLFAMRSQKQVTLEIMGSAFFMTVLIPYFLCSLLRLRQMEFGLYYLILPFVCAYLSDSTALFAGMLFGKHKLAPVLSPKKTVEGAVGGVFGAVMGCLIYGAVIQSGFQKEVNFLLLPLYGVVGSVVSQIGDLSFSYIKRQYGVKDFGRIFPGHGGVLDRFDSVIFCAPLIEILIKVLPVL